MILHLTEGDLQNTQKQNVDTVRIREVEEEIAVQRVTEDLGAVARETEINDVTAVARAGLIPQIVPGEKLDLFQEKSHEALRVVHNQIKQKLMLIRANL